MRRLRGRLLVSLGLSFVCVVVSVSLHGAAPPREDPRIARWIIDLDDEQFPVREAAQQELAKAGLRALPALTRAADSPSLEVHARIFRILRRLAADEAAAVEVRTALTRLAASSDERVASKARAVLQAQLDAIVAQLRNGGGRVTLVGDKVVAVDLGAAPNLVPLLPLLRKLPDLEDLSLSNKQMDDRGMAQIRGLPRLTDLNLFDSSIGDEGLNHLASFSRLRSVPMGHTKVTDAGLKHLAEMTHLEYVGLRGNKVTDAGLVHLRKLTNLTGLYLGETKVTDAGLKHLAGMKKMEYLRLHNVDVTDAGLEHLAGMIHLRQLDLWKTKVTAAGVERLKKSIPKVTVVLNER